MTIMSHAEIFSSLSGSFIIIYRLIRREPQCKIEIWATVVAFAGATVVNLDHQAKKVDPSSQNIILGNMICLLSSLFGAFNLHYSSELLNRLSMHYVLFLQALVTFVWLAPVGFILIDDFSLGLD
jgi:drug/metabolite transporter (DMT)-like permease